MPQIKPTPDENEFNAKPQTDAITLIALRQELSLIRSALRGYPDSDLPWLATNTRTRLDYAGLTLATLCDMVLGEGAQDRSDEALIRRVGAIFRAARDVVNTKSFTKDAPDVVALRKALEGKLTPGGQQ